MAPWQIRRWLKSGCGLERGLALLERHRRAGNSRLVFYDTSPDYVLAAEGAAALYAPAFRAALADQDAAHLFSGYECTGNIDVDTTSLILKTYLRENGIAQGDRLSMASSVEMRLPFVKP